MRAWVSILFLAGCTGAPTQLVVVVGSDLPVPRGLSRVAIAVSAEGEPDAPDEAMLELASAADLPLSFGVLPRNGDASRRPRIEVRGLGPNGQTTVTRTVITSFRRGLSLEVPVFLFRACADLRCAEGTTCTEQGCSAVEVATEDLSPNDPGQEGMGPVSGAPPAVTTETEWVVSPSGGGARVEDVEAGADGLVWITGNVSGAAPDLGTGPLTVTGCNPTDRMATDYCDVDAFAAAYEPNGTPVHAARFEGIGFGHADSIDVGPDGSGVIGGEFRDTFLFADPAHCVGNGLPGGCTSGGDSDGFIGTFGPGLVPTGLSAFGGTRTDFTEAVILGPGNLAYGTGQVNGAASFAMGQTGGPAGFIFAYDRTSTESLSLLWTLPGSPAHAEGLAMDGSGHVVACGYTAAGMPLEGSPASADGLRDAYVIKLSPSGAVIWGRSFPALGNSDACEALVMDADDNIYLVGDFESQMDLGGLTVTSNGDKDGFVVSLTGDGDPRWARAIGGPDLDEAEDVAVGPDGSLYVTGNFQGTVDFAGDVRTSTGDADVYVASFGPGGNPRWLVTFGSVPEDAGRAIDVDDQGRIYAGGRIAGAATLPDGVALDGGTLYLVTFREVNAP